MRLARITYVVPLLPDGTVEVQVPAGTWRLVSFQTLGGLARVVLESVPDVEVEAAAAVAEAERIVAR